MKHTDVFVPGGFPLHTYNPRGTQKLEDKLKEAKENLCKLVTVTGHTKSGKTVLTRSVFPKDACVWVDGGSIFTEEELWSAIVDQLDLYSSTEKAASSESAQKLSGTISTEAGALLLKGKSSVTGESSETISSGMKQARSSTALTTALKGLRNSKTPLVIDDFHYIPQEIQGPLIRALKPLIFDGAPIVIIAIPHKRYDAIKVEREMTGRISNIEIPEWQTAELGFIPRKGFKLLKYEVSENVISRFIEESIGSPHLIQEFCRATSKKFEQVKQTPGFYPPDLGNEDINQIFGEVAEALGGQICEKLARGPRQRTDRMKRTLKSGVQVDIYKLLLHALSHIKPNLISLEYETIRQAVRDVLADPPPQIHEISRVLKEMSKIAADEQNPVIEFEDDGKEKKLHIIDPFFAFFLRWGKI